MARLARAEVFAHDEIATVHVMNRVVRRCFLMGDDPLSGKNFDHRKDWIETLLIRLAAQFGIDLIGFAILSNHFHLILRSRPDRVAQWNDAEVARRWLLLCPKRKDADGNPVEPTRPEIDQIRNNPVVLAKIRGRLSEIAWWMRLLCQRIAQRANADDGELGKFWQSRYRAVRLLDEAALVACAAYVDLNPIRAGIATTLADSDHTSVQRRIEALSKASSGASEQQPSASPPADSSLEAPANAPDQTVDFAPDCFLSPLPIDEAHDPLGPHPAQSSHRCSDKGFLAMTTEAYLELLAWTAENRNHSPAGRRSGTTPEALGRLGISAESWCRLVGGFGKLFSLIAGRPAVVDEARSRTTHRRYRLGKEARDLLAGTA